jgi:ribose transport system substrate-binding protein
MLVALSLCAALVACSDSSDSADDDSGGPAVDTSEYQTTAESFTAEVTEFTGPTEGSAAVADKKLMVLSCTQAAEGCALPAAAAVEAAEVLGWEASIFDGQGSPDTYNKGIQQAITSGMDGILLIAISDELVADAVADARAAGIAVISEDSVNEPSETGVNFENAARLEDQAKALASYLIWKNDGKAKVLLMWDREFKSVLRFNEAFAKEIAACEECELVAEQDFVVTELQDRVPELVVSTLRQEPEINAVVNFDAPQLFTVPEVKAAGVGDGVLFGGFNGISPAIDLVRSGDVAATVGQAMEWAAWASVDAFNRIFAGEEPVDGNVPMRLITADNVDDVESGKPWDGDVDFRAAYRELWGK